MFSIFVQFVAALAFLGGVAFAVTAFITPYNYSLSSASAIQVSQVYAEATYYGVMAVVLFVFAIALMVSSIAAKRAS